MFTTSDEIIIEIIIEKTKIPEKKKSGNCRIK